MPSDPDKPAGPEPDARAAAARLREGLARVRRIVSEARQAIGRAPPEGPVLADAPATGGPEESGAEEESASAEGGPAADIPHPRPLP